MVYNFGSSQKYKMAIPIVQYSNSTYWGFEIALVRQQISEKVNFVNFPTTSEYT